MKVIQQKSSRKTLVVEEQTFKMKPTMLHRGMGGEYDNVDVSKMRVKELKKLCADAGIVLKGSYEKRDLIKEAEKALEILKNGGGKAGGKEEEKPRETVTVLNSIEEFDKFTKGGLMSVVAFIDKS